FLSGDGLAIHLEHSGAAPADAAQAVEGHRAETQSVVLESDLRNRVPWPSVPCFRNRSSAPSPVRLSVASRRARLTHRSHSGSSGHFGNSSWICSRSC